MIQNWSHFGRMVHITVRENMEETKRDHTKSTSLACWWPFNRVAQRL